MYYVYLKDECEWYVNYCRKYLFQTTQLQQPLKNCHQSTKIVEKSLMLLKYFSIKLFLNVLPLEKPCNNDASLFTIF